MIQVQVDPRLAAEGLIVSAIVATPAKPSESGRLAYRRFFDETLADLRQRDPNAPEPPTIATLRQLHARYGGRSKRVELPQLKLAQSLLQGKFKSIQPIVDVYNLWSARLGLSIGAFDIDRIQGSVSLRVTSGSERFKPIGATESKIVEAGAFAYVDDSGEVLCWLDVRQGDPTKVTASTRRALIIVEGISPIDRQELEAITSRIAASLLITEAVSSATLIEPA
jgi:DNA/RNA-binding domain of Phe-tRNA-synthetase-like protein